MDHESIRNYCLSKPQAAESLPFDDQTLVFKVGGKMFAVLALDEPNLALKASPDEVMFRLEHYPEVQPPRYFDKRHWHFVHFDNLTDEKLLLQWIDWSYELIVSSLPKKTRIALNL
ncbi:MAG: MmcQ/YjbR family DNA-binding protein [Bacteroidetes bacterium]|nr:MmcQ/YjbR family DNA-binding protein [Bacteroidota bacterium]